MAVGDRVRNPDSGGYAAYEVTDETVVGGEKQVAALVKIVGDDGSTSAPATAANQDTLNTNLGAKADSAASSDTGTFSLIQLVKRGLQSLTSLVTSLALLEPAARCAAVTPADGADLANNTRALMVTVAGDVKVDFVTTGTGVILTDLQPGIAYPFRVKRVYSTLTTATGILALW